MAFTAHGHHIPGTEFAALWVAPETVINCGGPAHCADCADGVSKWWDPTPADRTHPPISGGRSVREQLQELTYSEGTLFKVYEALKEAGLTQQQAIDAINKMQNFGIYFREAKEN